MASSVIRFFKIVLTKNLQDGTLKVPEKFSKKYGDGVPNPVYLKPPDGTQWKIDWTNYDGEILFEKGWKEFAAYYSLYHGHMLRFEYNGTSNIEIHILDMSGLEIDYPSNDHISGDNSVGISNEQLPPVKEKAKEVPEPSSPCRSKRLKRTAKTRDVERSPSNEEDSQSEETPSLSNEEDNHSEETQPKMLRKRSKKPYVNDYSSNDNSDGISKKQQQQEKKEKAAPKPSSPSRSKRLKLTVQTTDVEGSPDTQNRKHNANNEEDSQSEETQIKTLIKRFRRPYVDAFSPCTNGFLALNEAQKFKSENPSFIVKATQANISGSTANFQASFFRKYFKKKDQNIQIRFERDLFPAKLCYYQHHSLAIISAGWRLFARRSKLQPGDVTVFELINREDPLFDVHIYRAQEQASDLRTGGFQHLKEAQKFSSENPFFIVKMMQYNLSRSRTTVPNSFFMKYFKKKEPTVKIRFENKLWPAKLLYYPLLSKAYITIGWKPFSIASNVKAGDVCIFELIEVKDRVLDVHIYRADD